MKKKVSISILAAFQLAVATLLSAQTPSSDNSVPALPPGPPPFPKASVSEMVSRMLSLTDAQKAQFQIYFDAAQPQLDQIHEQARQAADNVMKQLAAQIRPLLTPEQQIRLDQIEAMRAAGPPAPAVSGSTSTAQ